MTRDYRKPLFKSPHLLAIDNLSSQEAIALLDLAEKYVEVSRQIDKRHSVLQGRTQVNLFFEASTRTQSSFEIAGKRLGADVMNMSVSSSSMRKGETLIDTAVTLNATPPARWNFWRARSTVPSSTPATVPTSIRPRRCWTR